MTIFPPPPSKPLIERYRDFALILLGSLVGLLGTCSSQFVQTQTHQRELAAAAAERVRASATSVFDEVSRANDALVFAQGRLWDALLRPSATNLDTARARVQAALSEWQINLPRRSALVATYFGDDVATFMLAQDSMAVDFVGLVNEIERARATMRFVPISQAQLSTLPDSVRRKIVARDSSGRDLDGRIAEQIRELTDLSRRFERRMAERIRDGDLLGM